MCGRAYETFTEEELELRYLNRRRRSGTLFNLSPTYNLAPTQLAPVILIRDDEIEIDRFRWGLVPSWAKDLQSIAKYSLINAKAEEIETKNSYKEAFQLRRCIVPVSGFFEWKQGEGGPKRPFAIYLKESPIMSLAGIWEYWEAKDTGQKISSFSIITCSSNSMMKEIHHRMPVILDQTTEMTWLDPKNKNHQQLKDILKPCPSEWMAAHEISTLVNSPKNNRSEILKPLSG